MKSDKLTKHPPWQLPALVPQQTWGLQDSFAFLPNPSQPPLAIWPFPNAESFKGVGEEDPQ